MFFTLESPYQYFCCNLRHNAMPYMYSKMQNKLSKTRGLPLESMGQIISSRCPLGSFDTYEAHYNSVQTSLIPKRNEYEHHIEELELARQMMEDKQKVYDQTAPNAEKENREAEVEGSKESGQFVYFYLSRVVEHRHYDIQPFPCCT